ncbi:hypothetical protein B5C34_12385 [Pacificimonas flava]|uniref:Uncharacterized protein n=3 Tax=Sphingosinicellaceae TaxID=2820280 RepID=A0A219BAD6_9SPHN|nr:hypothetical protein [Pacificimonas aurantium]OWV34769.1 hypothetical protein B5C34_12385 [Pacificimonas flava]
MSMMAALAAGGGISLRRSWGSRGKGGGVAKAGGWALLLAACTLGSVTLGSIRGVFVAMTLASVAVLAVVAGGMVVREPRRSARNKSLAPEPLERKPSWWRSTLRWLLAGPIGMVAAMAVGIFWSVWAGGAEQTRLVIGGLLVPVTWGAAMAWTLADNRILRATAVLVGVAVLGFGLSILKGFG